MPRTALIAGSMVVALCGTTAWAQDPVPVQAEAPAVQDGIRFRGGISLGGGIEKVSVVSGPMGGLDGRLGVQINDLFAIYAQPHLSFGSLSTGTGAGGVSGSTGTFSFAMMAEATLSDRFFGGAGFGYGVLNNPSGPMFQARVGGYPMMSRDADGGRRKGLMAGVDFRSVFVQGATGILVLASIGYEKY